MNKSEQREWQEGALQGYLWTDVLDENGDVVAKVLTHKMTRPYASEPTPQGMANLALVKQAPRLLTSCKALSLLAEDEAYTRESFADTPEVEAAVREAWAIIDAAREVMEEARP
jgi:hypothetical protein